MPFAESFSLILIAFSVISWCVSLEPPTNAKLGPVVRVVADDERLARLGEDEARAALEEQGRIEVVCEYCGRRRHFDAIDVERLFSDNVVPAPDSLH